MKARQLVQLAASAGIERDKISYCRALEDAIWLTQTNEGTSQVFHEMGIPLDKKTTSCSRRDFSYEFMLMEFRIDYLKMLKWLGSGNSYPSDIGLLGQSGGQIFIICASAPKPPFGIPI